MAKSKIVVNQLVAECGAPEGVRASAEVVIAGYPQFLRMIAIDVAGNRHEVFPGKKFHSEFSDAEYKARMGREELVQRGTLRR